MRFLPKIWKHTQLLWFSNMLCLDVSFPRVLSKVFASLMYLIPCYASWLSRSFLHINELKLHIYQFSCMCFRLYRRILKVWEKYHPVCCSQLQTDMEHARRLFQGNATMVTSWWTKCLSVSICRLKWTFISVCVRNAVMMWVCDTAMKHLVFVN